MAKFNREWLPEFLGVVRKYMQMRGPMSQKELAEKTNVGVSTMSRFLNQKTSDLGPELIAKIIAGLEIPMHEVIDFINPGYQETFIRLVRFQKGEEQESPGGDAMAADRPRADASSARVQEDINHTDKESSDSGESRAQEKSMEWLAGLSFRKGRPKGSAPIGPGQRGPGEKTSVESTEAAMKLKLEQLTPRQRAYIQDFLNLDMEGRDLMVDLGTSLFRYFRQKGMDF